MCDVCQAFGLKSESAPGTEQSSGLGLGSRSGLTKNDDGTYTLRLTEAELKNLTVRLAMSVLAERRGLL